MPIDVTEGWSGDLDFVLKVNGEALPLAAGDTVSLILKTQDGRWIDTTGNVTKVPVDAGATPPIGPGTVRFSPDAGDFRAKDGPYLARWKLTLAGGKIVFFPNGREDRWNVFTP